MEKMGNESAKDLKDNGNEKIAYSGQIPEGIEEGYNVRRCPQQTVLLEEEEKRMKFQGINHEFYVQVITLLSALQKTL